MKPEDVEGSGETHAGALGLLLTAVSGEQTVACLPPSAVLTERGSVLPSLLSNVLTVAHALTEQRHMLTEASLLTTDQFY